MEKSRTNVSIEIELTSRLQIDLVRTFNWQAPFELRCRISQYYYRIFGVNFGPVSLELLQREIASGQLSGDHEVRCADETSWTRVADFIAQGFTHHIPTIQTTESIPTWNGRHGAIESVDTVVEVPAAKKEVEQLFCRGARVGRGPYTFDNLLSFARRGELFADDELSIMEHGPWTTVRSISSLMSEISDQQAKHSSPPLAVANPAENSVEKLAAVMAEQQPIPISHQPESTDHRSELADLETKTLWYVRMGRAEHGPFEFQKLIDMVTAGRILPMDRVRQSDQTEWTIAQTIPALFSSNSGSQPSGSSFSSKPTRPSLAEPTGSMQRVFTPQDMPIPPVTPVPVHHGAHPPFQPAATTVINSPTLDSAHSRRSVPQTLISGSDLKVESAQQSTLPKISLSYPERGRNDGVNQSPEQRKSGPYPKFDGESKLKARRGQVEKTQSHGLWNWIIAAAGCVLIIGVGRSMIPADVGQFESPLGELSTAYHALENERSENPNMEVKALATKEFFDKIDSTKQRIKNLSTEHPIRLILLTLSDNLICATKSETSDELTTHMEVSRNLLDFATREMQKWKDELLQKEGKRSTK